MVSQVVVIDPFLSSIDYPQYLDNHGSEITLSADQKDFVNEIIYLFLNCFNFFCFSCMNSVMKTLVSAVIVCSWYLEGSLGLTYWELKSLDIPPSHIPYFLSKKNSSGQGFCKIGDCQVQDLQR